MRERSFLAVLAAGSSLSLVIWDPLFEGKVASSGASKLREDLALLPLQGAISGRSHWNNMEKVCTSINLNKACRKLEELGESGGQGGRRGSSWEGVRARPELPCPSDAGMEALTLNLTEVVKRQNPKSKKGFNQVRALVSVKPHPQETYWTCVYVHMCMPGCVCGRGGVSARCGGLGEKEKQGEGVV